MSIFRSIYRRLSALPADEDGAEEVAGLWPDAQQSETSTLASRRGVVGLATVKHEPASDESEPASEESEPGPSQPLDIPDIKRTSDILVHEFMDKCVEIAVGEHIKESALKVAREKMDAAMDLHNLLRKDHSKLCHAVARASTLRPWYRSQKFLAETRLKLEADRGPVGEEDFWVPKKDWFDENALEEKFGPFDAREVITGWDERSWSPRSFKFVSWDDETVTSESEERPKWSRSSSESSFDERSSLASQQSVHSLRSLLQSDLEAVPSDEYDDDGSVSTAQAEDKYELSPWPSPSLEESDRSHIRRHCERQIDPRRASIDREERAALKQQIRERNAPVSQFWEKIRYAQADHRLDETDDASQVEICTRMLRAITEVEVEWEVHRENTVEQRNRAEMLVLRLQFELNGSKKLEKEIAAEMSKKRQKQKDIWEDIVCAAALRESPGDESTNPYGPVLSESPDQGEIGRAGVVMSIPKRDRLNPNGASTDVKDVPGLFDSAGTDPFGSGGPGRFGDLDRESTENQKETRHLRLDSGNPA